MNRAKRYNVFFDNWLTDVSSIWRPVPALTGYFDDVKNQIIEQEAGRYTVASVSSALKYHWDRVQEGSVVKQAKPKTTRLAFTTQEAIEEETNEPAAAAKANKSSSPKKLNAKPKKKANRKRKRSFNNAQNTSANVAAVTSTSSGPPNSTNQNTTYLQNQNATKECTACGKIGHVFTRCWLVRGEKDKDWVD